MIELDETKAIGNTQHGLIRESLSGFLREVDGVPWPLTGELPTPGCWPIQLIRKPGIADVPLSAAYHEAERLQGRVWQNYALLQSDWLLFGRRVDGWIYWASNGERWLVQPGITITTSANVGEPFALTLECQPFGHFEPIETAPVSLPVGVPDNGQTGSPAGRGVTVTSITSTGDRALLRLSSGGALPTGYLQIEITDTDGVLAATMTVLRTQEQALGDWEQDYPASPWWEMRTYIAIGDMSPPASVEKFPPGGGTYTLTVTGLLEVDGSVASTEPERLPVGSALYTAARTGRLVALMFDDADALVEYTATTRYSLDCQYPSAAGDVSGSITGTATYDADFADVMFTGSFSSEVGRTVSETLNVQVDLLRDGVVIEQTEATLAEQAEQRLAYSYSTSSPSYVGGGPRLMPGGQWRWLSGALAPSGSTGVDPVSGTISGPITGSYSTPAPYAEAFSSRSIVETLGPSSRINNVGKLPTAPGDQNNLSTTITFSNVDAGGGGSHVGLHYLETTQGGVRLLRFHSTSAPNVVVRNELAIHYPHASAAGRGPVGLNARQAYHPLTHELVTDSTGGEPVTFF
ncbi:hypothetical protein [Ectopseudomonas mendocina]|uniref:Uncharacterized protein n=1 Tax=Ectopseudomonas mendocina TaxID=300 RepID=A0A2R3QWQ8_ECTME|nr:hypothetical protein [Pseudomonas mendocina]AVO56163.1 hypothetical protein C7A17_26610 [Pseudomonas mendocina]